MVENNEIVWEKVCAMRESAGMTVADISARSGVPLTTVKRYFKGETKTPAFSRSARSSMPWTDLWMM